MSDQELLSKEEQTRQLLQRLSGLSASQQAALLTIVEQFERRFEFYRKPDSDLVSDCVLREFGDTLRVHHCFSAEAFTKDKFEYALERVLNFCKIPARRAARGNPGHDITIRDVPVSLKTQADAGIKTGFIHISKFMELGKGQWGDNVEDLRGLRDRFFNHMRSYDRILTLRRLRYPGVHHYELVEIPKELLLEAEHGQLTMMTKSTQNPKPGYCTVMTARGSMAFQLYFDGGTERKLQIRLIDKSLCIVHATWQFPSDDASAVDALFL